MEPRPHNALRERLEGQCVPLAAAWFQEISSISFVPLTQPELQQHLLNLVRKFIALLFSAPFNPEVAYSIGEELVKLQCWQPKVLERSQAILIEYLTQGLSGDDQMFIYSRSLSAFRYLTAGFSAEMYRTVLAKQAKAQASLFNANKEAQRTLWESEQRFRLLTEATFEGIVIHEKGFILDANNALAEMFGYDLSELRGQSVLMLTAPRWRGLVWAQIQANATRPYEAYGLRKNGIIFPLEVMGRPFPYRNKSARVAAVRDMTQRKGIEKDLRRARSQLALEREAGQQRLAHELHDGPIQQLIGLSYRLLEVKEIVHETLLPSAEAVSKVHFVYDGILSVVSDLRDMMRELRPPELDDAGLAEALKEYVRSLHDSSGLQLPEISLNMALDEGLLSEGVRINLFRIVQEALRNSLQHASARRIELNIYEVEKALWLEVKDDGCGFDVSKDLSHLTQAHSFGLVTMIERAEALGGSLRILSQPGKGTVLFARIPIGEKVREAKDD